MQSNCLVNNDSRGPLAGSRGPKRESRIKYRPKTLISDSRTRQNIEDYIDTVSSTNTTVLILGGSGVGKELIAKRSITVQGAQTKLS
jgi:transcriptional regulator with GAF, ATPase, and Fis domain